MSDERDDFNMDGINVFGQGTQSVKAVEESPNIRFTINGEAAIKVLLLKLQAVLTQERAPEKPSQGDIVKEALILLADSVGFEKLTKKHNKFVAHIDDDYVLNKKGR